MKYSSIFSSLAVFLIFFVANSDAATENSTLIDTTEITNTSAYTSDLSTTSTISGEPTYSAAAQFAHELNHNYYMAGAIMMAAACVLI